MTKIDSIIDDLTARLRTIPAATVAEWWRDGPLEAPLSGVAVAVVQQSLNPNPRHFSLRLTLEIAMPVVPGVNPRRQLNRLLADVFRVLELGGPRCAVWPVDRVEIGEIVYVPVEPGSGVMQVSIPLVFTDD